MEIRGRIMESHRDEEGTLIIEKVAWEGQDGKIVPFKDAPGGNQIGEATIQVDEEGVNFVAKIPEPFDYVEMMENMNFPEWLAGAADKEWEELDDWQKTWFENYRAFMDEQHKDLAVKPKDTPSLAGRMKVHLAQTQSEATEKINESKTVIHFMSYDKHGSKGPGVYCSCGMSKIHRRGKVLAAWADKHFEKYGHYWKRT